MESSSGIQSLYNLGNPIDTSNFRYQPEEPEEDETDIMFKFNTNNHKIEGKHSLSRDTIFKGKLDEIRIYNRVLSSEEILYNYNTQKARFGL